MASKVQHNMEMVRSSSERREGREGGSDGGGGRAVMRGTRLGIAGNSKAKRMLYVSNGLGE